MRKREPRPPTPTTSNRSAVLVSLVASRSSGWDGAATGSTYRSHEIDPAFTTATVSTGHDSGPAEIPTIAMTTETASNPTAPAYARLRFVTAAAYVRVRAPPSGLPNSYGDAIFSIRRYSSKYTALGGPGRRGARQVMTLQANLSRWSIGFVTN
jgi:hypothetical protein